MIVCVCLPSEFSGMLEILTYLLAIALGFAALGYSADRLIEVSSTLAFKLGMPVLTIGMTIVAFGTSAPELAVSAVAAIEGSGSIAIGNALGSNIINTGLVLSICGLVAPLVISRRILSHELPLLAGVTALALALMADNVLTQTDGYILATGLVAYCIYLSKHQDHQDNSNTDSDVVILPINTFRAVLEVLAMLVILVASSKLLVWGSSELARSFGISEMVIGLTIIAFGTSLPELAAALACVRKGMFDMLMAMIIGSNIFNLLGVLTMPSLLAGDLQLELMAFTRDSMAMLGLTSILLISAISSILPLKRLRVAHSGSTTPVTTGCTISRFKSGILLTGFIIYMAVLAVTF